MLQQIAAASYSYEEIVRYESWIEFLYFLEASNSSS